MLNELNYTRTLMTIQHAFMTVVLIFVQIERIGYQGLKMALNFAGMLFSIYLLLKVADCNFRTPAPAFCKNLDTAAMVTWFRVELVLNFGIILSNVVFLFLRAIFKHKMQVDDLIDARKKTSNIDTLLALQKLANAFHNEAVPLIISTVLYLSPGNVLPDGTIRTFGGNQLQFQLNLITGSNYINTFFIAILVFVSWKKGPTWWTKISPYLFFALLMFVYFVVPFLNVVLALALILFPDINLRQSMFESWAAFYMSLQIIKIFDYFFTIRREYLHDAKMFLATRKMCATENEDTVRLMLEQQAE